MPNDTPATQTLPSNPANKLSTYQNDTAELLRRTGADGRVTVSHQRGKGAFISAAHDINDAGAAVDSLTDCSVWISAAATRAPGRGSAKDTARLLTLPLDIDIKPAGIADGVAAYELVEVLSQYLGTPPMAVVATGGGIQPWWWLDPTDPQWCSTGPTDPHLVELQTLVKRWGRCARYVVEQHNWGALDSVFDLARMLRAPSSTNYKYETPRPVSTTFNDNATPLTFAQVKNVLDHVHIPTYLSDGKMVGTVVQHHSEWAFADDLYGTSAYVLKMLEGWATDEPKDGNKSGRHGFLMYMAIRLQAAHRAGVITERDYYRGIEVMTKRFNEVLKITTFGAGFVRDPGPDEVAGVLSWARDAIEADTPEELADRPIFPKPLGTLELGNNPSVATQEWAPLRDDKPLAVNPAPVDIAGLPQVMSDMVTASAAASGAPRDVALAAALGVAAAATRGVYDATIEGAWFIKTTALWTLALAGSGAGKGDGFGPITKPLNTAETDVRAQVIKENRTRKVERDRLNMKLKAAMSEGDEAGAEKLTALLHESRERPVPLYVLDDATPEALGQTMQHNGGPVALISTEGEQFISAANGYATGAARLGLFNRAKDGERFADVRVSRPGTVIHRPVLTWVFAVQPEVLRGYASAHTEGSGFLPRFIYFQPQPTLGTRVYPLPQIPIDVRQAWDTAITQLHQVSWELHKQLTDDPDTPQAGPCLRFTDDAAAMMLALKNDVEAECMDPRGRFLGITAWAQKNPTDVGRIATVLALLENPHTTRVGAEHVTAALSLVPGFIAHARAAFDGLRGQVTEDCERRTLEAIMQLGKTTVTTRDIHRKLRGQAWVHDVDDVRQVLADLSQRFTGTDSGPIRGPIRIQVADGGRPSESWQCHPGLFKGNDDN